MTSRQHTTDNLNLETKINDVLELKQLYNVITNVAGEEKHIYRGFGEDLTDFLAFETEFWYYETFKINYSIYVTTDVSPIPILSLSL